MYWIHLHNIHTFIIKKDYFICFFCSFIKLPKTISISLTIIWFGAVLYFDRFHCKKHLHTEQATKMAAKFLKKKNIYNIWIFIGIYKDMFIYYVLNGDISKEYKIRLFCIIFFFKIFGIWKLCVTILWWPLHIFLKKISSVIG